MGAVNLAPQTFPVGDSTSALRRGAEPAPRDLRPPTPPLYYSTTSAARRPPARCARSPRAPPRTLPSFLFSSSALRSAPVPTFHSLLDLHYSKVETSQLKLQVPLFSPSATPPQTYLRCSRAPSIAYLVDPKTRGPRGPRNPRDASIGCS